MELGIHPYVTSGMVLQLLIGAKLFELDIQKNKEDKELHSGLQKCKLINNLSVIFIVMAIIIAVC